MPKSRTTFQKGQNNPRVSRNKKTLIMEAMRRQAVFGLGKDATNEECEIAWFDHLLNRAADPDDDNSALCLRLLTERGWSAIKPTTEPVEFEFDPTATATVRASQILDAVAKGIVPIEQGVQLVSAIKSMTDIEQNTEIKDRIAAIEEKLGVNQ